MHVCYGDSKMSFVFRRRDGGGGSKHKGLMSRTDEEEGGGKGRRREVRTKYEGQSNLISFTWISFPATAIQQRKIHLFQENLL